MDHLIHIAKKLKQTAWDRIDFARAEQMDPAKQNFVFNKHTVYLDDGTSCILAGHTIFITSIFVKLFVIGQFVLSNFFQGAWDKYHDLPFRERPESFEFDYIYILYSLGLALGSAAVITITLLLLCIVFHFLRNYGIFLSNTIFKTKWGYFSLKSLFHSDLYPEAFQERNYLGFQKINYWEALRLKYTKVNAVESLLNYFIALMIILAISTLAHTIGMDAVSHDWDDMWAQYLLAVFFYCAAATLIVVLMWPFIDLDDLDDEFDIDKKKEVKLDVRKWDHERYEAWAKAKGYEPHQAFALAVDALEQRTETATAGQSEQSVQKQP